MPGSTSRRNAWPDFCRRSETDRVWSAATSHYEAIDLIAQARKYIYLIDVRLLIR
jgi:hypothetical protein